MSETHDRQTAGGGDRKRAGFVQRLLRVSLFYKILLANAMIVLIGTVGGAVLSGSILRGNTEFPVAWVVVLALGGILVTVLVNAVILRVALRPLEMLEETAARVQTGDVDARVPYSPLRDRELERLTGTFNAMLDNLESYRQRLSGIAARAMNAEEKERKRIARELHDDTAQYLAALLIRLRLIRGADDPRARDAALDQFRNEIGEALERIRRFARGLRPPALDELGLVPALESHVRGLAESVGIAIRIQAEPIEDLLTQQAELALYRIAQEAISNAVRHAEPDRIDVRITREAAYVVLTVTDDGVGFQVEKMVESDDSGLGLFGMKERAIYVGGQVEIDSVPGEGTVVRVAVPVTVGRRQAYSGGAATGVTP
jgi:two-component system sensor histidine kinase UhpB